MGASLTVLLCGAGTTDVPAVPSATLQAIDAEAATIRSDRCNTTQGSALTSVDKAMDIVMKASVITQGITYPIPANRDQIAARRWQILLRQPAASRVVMCDAAARSDWTPATSCPAFRN